MRGRNGAFDADNTFSRLDDIAFADHSNPSDRRCRGLGVLGFGFGAPRLRAGVVSLASSIAGDLGRDFHEAVGRLKLIEKTGGWEDMDRATSSIYLSHKDAEHRTQTA
jgi:hypothetical protein